MLKTIRETTIRLLPFAVLVAEILIFYAGFGWGLGVGIPKSPHFSNLQSDILLCYVFGAFSFIFFIVFLPPDTVKHPFLLAATIFIVAALPCFFLSQALTDTLHLNGRLTPDYYAQALKGCWDTRSLLLPAFLPHLFGFMLALTLRKTMRKLFINFKSMIKFLKFKPKSGS